MSSKGFITLMLGIVLIVTVLINSSSATTEAESTSVLKCIKTGKCKVQTVSQISIGESLGTSKMANCPSTCQMPLDQALIKAYPKFLSIGMEVDIESENKTIILTKAGATIAVLNFYKNVTVEDFLSKTRFLVPSLDNNYKPILVDKIPVWRSYGVDR